MPDLRLTIRAALAALVLNSSLPAFAATPHSVETMIDDPIPLPPRPAVAATAEAGQAVADVLAQLPAGFVLPYRDTRTVAQEFDWLMRNPDYLERVFRRAQPYMPHILEQLRARGMPLELALLPVVESAYDPFAYSHGQAAGLWQFIPATASRFGIDQNWWYDGRRDLLDSTRAALDYLERLHEIFDGDWLLAIAAYNSGEGKVRRALRRAGPDASFWELALPRETRMYVPRLLALSRIVSAPGDFGVVLPPVADTVQFAVVDTGGQLDLALAAELAGVGVDTLYRFNPGLNRWATPPEGPHRLLLPVAHASQLRQGLAGLPENERLSWKRYRIAPGDTLSTIAASHRITVASLRGANRLGGTTIRAGDYLLIPTASRAASAYTLSAESRQAATLARSPDALEYTVRPGDSLWTIARRHDVGVRELAAWNAMAPRDTLRVGRTLVIRGGKHTAGVTAALTPPETQRRIHYVVRRGDSLARISSKFSVTISQLKRWNRTVAQQKYLYPGQRLVMYIDVRRQSGG